MNRNQNTVAILPFSVLIPALQVIGFALLTAIAAQFRIPLPFTPVPITLQTLVVLLGGAILGWKKGAASQSLYLVWGIIGAPLFSGGSFGLMILAGPTGGYLVGFIAAALTAGYLAPRCRTYIQLNFALLASSLVILGLGTTHLTFVVGMSWSAAFLAGFLPFLPGEVIKVVAAAGIVKAYKRYSNRS